MRAKLDAKLIRRAIRVSEQAHKVQYDLTDAFRARYGVTYSDVDCDFLIDLFDYGGGDVPSLAQCDAAMAACGVKPLAQQEPKNVR